MNLIDERGWETDLDLVPMGFVQRGEGGAWPLSQEMMLRSDGGEGGDSSQCRSHGRFEYARNFTTICILTWSLVLDRTSERLLKISGYRILGELTPPSIN